MVKCIAFDCFGTVFDMSTVSREEISDYVQHVKKADFSPYAFSDAWFDLKAHPDSAEGIRRLQSDGYKCVTLSNGGWGMLGGISAINGIIWDHITDLIEHRAYKPNNLDAYRAIEKDLGFFPSQTLMVTANPTFGDIKGAAAIGMPSQVIRHGYPNTIIELAEMLNSKV